MLGNSPYVQTESPLIEQLRVYEQMRGESIACMYVRRRECCIVGQDPNEKYLVEVRVGLPRRPLNLGALARKSCRQLSSPNHRASHSTAHALIACAPHTRPAGNMRLIHAAVAGFLALATADSNLTHGSKNILPSTFNPPQHFRNTNLVRNINLEKSYPRETINVVVENVDKQPQTEYYLPFEQGVIGRIGGLEAKDKKDASKAPFNVEIVALDETR